MIEHQFDLFQGTREKERRVGPAEIKALPRADLGKIFKENVLFQLRMTHPRYLFESHSEHLEANAASPKQESMAILPYLLESKGKI